MKEPPKALVCASADALMMSAGTTFGMNCANCSTPLMISLSGKNFLRLNPGAIVICEACITPEDVNMGAADPEELLGELANRIPNWRRNRN